MHGIRVVIRKGIWFALIQLIIQFLKTSYFHLLKTTLKNWPLIVTKEILYYRYPGGICKIGIDATEPETDPFIARANGFYTLAYDEMDNTLYGTDPLDYVQNGWVFRYNADNGAVIDSIESGIIPGEIYFVP